MLMLENLPPNVFSSMKTLPKKINSCFTSLMTKEKDLVGNTSGPTMEEFTLDKLMTVFITIRYEKDLEQIEKPTAGSRNLYGSSGFADSP